jgi:hypothetical protein
MEIEDFLQSGQKIEVTVWDSEEDDSDGYSFPSLIRDYREGRLFIENPRGDDAPLFDKLKPGYLVGVVAATEASLLMFYPRVSSTSNRGSYGTILSLDSDTQYEIIQRRKLIRVPFTVPVQVDILRNGEVLHRVEAKTVNISGGGLRIASPFHFDVGQLLLVFLKLGDLRGAAPGTGADPDGYSDRAILKLSARVVFSQQNNNPLGSADKFFAGVCFDNLSEAQQTILMRECFRRELSLRRNKTK